jgi:hypothetical protein
MGENRYACGVLMGKPEGRRPLGRSKRGCEDNVNMYLQEIGWRVDLIHVTQDRDTWRAVLHVDEPSGSIKYRDFLNSRRIISFSRRSLPHGVVNTKFTSLAQTGS